MAKKNQTNVALDISKSQLGKLLASENIRIEHQKVQGPFFDVKNRTLVLPLWKDMDADLYDLFIGHEVGHALFTPPSGWEGKIKQHGTDFKPFMNIVEDVRIEKKMKRKYPGLKKPMYAGYTQLVERGFFGIPMEAMNFLPFADRVNVHFKLGARAAITFNEEEQVIVDMIENAETWDEVIAAAEILFKKSKEEKNMFNDLFNDLMEDSQGQGDSGSESQDGDPQGGEPSSEQSNSSSRSRKELREKLEEASEDVLNALKEWAGEKGTSSLTEDAMKDNQKDLIDASAYPYIYVKLPEINLKNWVIPAKVVHKLMNTGFTPKQRSGADAAWRKFMSVNKRYVDNMVKEFELRRNAKQLAKAKVSKSGELDVSKIWKYRLSEDLFRQTTVVPNGKNHGMLMVVDMSSSMTDNMAGTLEQILCMSMFCRKVGIPFDVYSFINNGGIDAELSAVGFKGSYSTRHGRNSTKIDKSIMINDSTFRLQQLLSNKMSFTEYNNAVKNLVVLANAFKGEGRRYSYGYYGSPDVAIPPNMQLSGTPLNEAVLVLFEVARRFREETKVEVLTSVVLTDGEGSYTRSYVEGGQQKAFPYDVTNIVIEDSKTKKSIVFNNHGDMTLALLDLYGKVTDSRVVGYYLMAGGNFKSQIETKMRNYKRSSVLKENQFNQAQFDKQYEEQFSKERFFAGEGVRGYDTYYMVPGSELEIEEVSLDKILKGRTASSKSTGLLTAFKKMQNTKQVSRVFVRKFIGGIS